LLNTIRTEWGHCNPRHERVFLHRSREQKNTRNQLRIASQRTSKPISSNTCKGASKQKTSSPLESNLGKTKALERFAQEPQESNATGAMQNRAHKIKR
jgi:hypothetical protein